MEGQCGSSWSQKPGTYVLLMTLAEPIRLEVGRLGVFPLRAGWYAYAGSALGPGGLNARLSRHTREEKRLRWHIDYLLTQARLREVWYSEDLERRECAWIKFLGNLPGTEVPVPGFGASDCRCRSHLFGLTSYPSFSAFSRRAGVLSGEKIRRVILDDGQPALRTRS
jgi:Uri superfamily endonuclease